MVLLLPSHHPHRRVTARRDRREAAARDRARLQLPERHDLGQLHVLGGPPRLWRVLQWRGNPCPRPRRPVLARASRAGRARLHHARSRLRSVVDADGDHRDPDRLPDRAGARGVLRPGWTDGRARVRRRQLPSGRLPPGGGDLLLPVSAVLPVRRPQAGFRRRAARGPAPPATPPGSGAATHRGDSAACLPAPPERKARVTQAPGEAVARLG